jgi:transportin-3
MSTRDTTNSWQAIEAHLYCFRSIARHVEKQLQDPNVQRSIEMIFCSLSFFPDHPAIRYTSCLILSRYATWLSQNHQYLGPQMQFLHQTIMNSTQSTTYSEWEVPRAAATAIRSIGMDCWSFIGKELVQFYLYIQKHDVLEVEDQVLILEGMCQGVCTTTTTQRNQILELMEQCIQPILERLSSSSATQNSTLILQEILRLMCFFEYISIIQEEEKQQHPLVVLTEKIWPLFNQVLNFHKQNDQVVERVCRCYKRMLRTCGSHFKPFIPQMIENLVGFYQMEPKASYLYCGSMVLKYFSEEVCTSLSVCMYICFFFFFFY